MSERGEIKELLRQTLLSAATLAENRIYVEPTFRDQVKGPMVIIRALSEEVEALDSHSYKRSLQLETGVIVQQGASTVETADTLAQEVEESIESLDLILSQWCKITLQRIEFQQEFMAELPIVKTSLYYLVEYECMRPRKTIDLEELKRLGIEAKACSKA